MIPPLEERIATARVVSAPVCADLAQVGHACESIDDLRQSRTRYVTAVPVLIGWLPRLENLDVRESIVRALFVPWARPTATRGLVAEFRRVGAPPDARTSSYQWAVGNALEVVGDESVVDDMLEFARDRQYGTARQMVVLGLGKLRDERITGVLIGLLDDHDVSGHAVKALGRRNDSAAREPLETMLDDDRAWVRREAKKALKRLA